MIKMIKLFGLFIFFVFVLSVKVKDRTLFSYLYDHISPATMAAQKTAENFLGRSATKAKDYSKKLFDNSVPTLKDSVKSRMAAHEDPEEEITIDEQYELEELIKSHE